MLMLVKRDIVSKIAPQEEHKASWFHHSLIRQNLFFILTLIKSY